MYKKLNQINQVRDVMPWLVETLADNGPTTAKLMMDHKVNQLKDSPADTTLATQTINEVKRIMSKDGRHAAHDYAVSIWELFDYPNV